MPGSLRKKAVRCCAVAGLELSAQNYQRNKEHYVTCLEGMYPISIQDQEKKGLSSFNVWNGFQKIPS